jgi:hypothetical protein
VHNQTSSSGILITRRLFDTLLQTDLEWPLLQTERLHPHQSPDERAESRREMQFIAHLLSFEAAHEIVARRFWIVFKTTNSVCSPEMLLRASMSDFPRSTCNTRADRPSLMKPSESSNTESTCFGVFASSEITSFLHTKK